MIDAKNGFRGWGFWALLALIGCSPHVELGRDKGAVKGTGGNGGDTDVQGDGGPGAGGAPGGDTGSGGTGGNVDNTGGGGAGGAVRTPQLDALCNAPGGTELVFDDEADAQAHLVGRWALCQGPGLTFATEQQNQAGVEFTADMTWYLLDRVGGSLTRAGGFDSSDMYRFQPPQDLEYGPSKNMLLFLGADYSFANATMLDSPRKLRIAFSSPLNDAPSIYVREPEQ